MVVFYFPVRGHVHEHIVSCRSLITRRVLKGTQRTLSCFLSVWFCALTGHSDGDVSRCSGRGLGVRWAERLQADGRLVAFTQWRPLAARCLTDAETLHVQHHTVHTGKAGLRTDRRRTGDDRHTNTPGLLLLFTSAVTHHDAESFEDVEFTHGTGAVFVQPRVHTHFMEDMSADRERRDLTKPHD